MFKKWFYKRQNGWFTLSAITGLSGGALIASLNADYNEGWRLAGGIILLVAAAYFMYKAGTTSTGKGG